MWKLAAVLVFCVLLVNISAHEHQRVHHEHHSLSLKHLHHARRSHNREKSGNNEDCHSQSHLHFDYNNKTKIEQVSNTTAKVGVITDIKAHISVLYDNRTNAVIVVNYGSGVGYVVKVSVQSLQHYLSNASLRPLLQAGREGAPFNVSSDSTPEEISRILSSLSFNYTSSSQLLSDIRRSAQALSRLPNVCTSSGNFNGDFSSLARRLQGIFSTINSFGGNFNRNSSLDLARILSYPSGFRIFVHLLQNGANPNQVQQIVRRFVSSPQQFFSLISNLGGNSNPFDSSVGVFSNLFNLSRNSSSIQNAINSLIRFYGNGWSSNNLSSFRSQVGPAVQEALRLYRSSGLNQTYPGFGNILQNLLNGNASFNASNFFPIISALTQNSGNGSIDNIIHILSLFNNSGMIPFQQSIPQLLRGFVSTDPSLLRNIIPNFNLTRQQLITLGQSLRRVAVNYLKLMQSGAEAGHNFAKLFEGIPFINLFVIPMDIGLQIYSNGAATFANIIEHSDAITSFIQGFASMPEQFANFFIQPAQTFFNMFQEAAGSLTGGSGGEGQNSNTSGTNQSGQSAGNPLGAITNILGGAGSSPGHSSSEENGSGSGTENGSSQQGSAEKPHGGHSNAATGTESSSKQDTSGEGSGGGSPQQIGQNLIGSILGGSSRHKSAHGNKEHHHSKGKKYEKHHN